MSELVTIRERIIRARNYFTELHGVVLTTFNLDPVFLEDNALPAIFGIEDENRSVREAELHKQLAITPCTVFYDPSTEPKFGGGYRYVAQPVPIPGNFFHPKLVILAGQRDSSEESTRSKYDTQWVYLAVSSANLTRSGWGRNVESFGETWIHTQKQQSWRTLHKFLEWISSQNSLKMTQNDSDAVAKVLKTLDSMENRRRFGDNIEKPWSGTLYAKFYSSVVHNEGFPAFIHEHYSRRPSCIWVYSPYWGDIPNQLKSFNAKKTKLVPALRQRDGKISITQDQAKELALPNLIIKKNKRDIGERFWHMKAYWIERGSRCYIAVGSCNFTKAGLSGKNENVETMLIFNTYEDDGTFPGGKEVQPEEFATEPEPEEEIPNTVPISIVVAWDWKNQMWHWNLADDKKQRECKLQLPKCDNYFRIKPGANSTDGQPPEPGATFTIYYRNPEENQKWEEWTGSVVELNLDHSARTYGVPLNANQILDSWRKGLAVGSSRSREYNELDNVDESTQNNVDTPAVFDAVNLFDFYRALRDLKFELSNKKLSEDRKKAILIGHSNSVLALTNLAYNDSKLPVVRYLVLFELNKLISEHKKLLGDVHVSNVESMFDEVKELTHRELKEDPRLNNYNSSSIYEIMGWFEKNLNELDYKEIP